MVFEAVDPSASTLAHIFLPTLWSLNSRRNIRTNLISLPTGYSQKYSRNCQRPLPRWCRKRLNQLPTDGHMSGFHRSMKPRRSFRGCLLSNGEFVLPLRPTTPALPKETFLVGEMLKNEVITPSQSPSVSSSVFGKEERENLTLCRLSWIKFVRI